MNKMLILIFLIIQSFAVYAEDWTTLVFREDETNQYWVGISSSQKDIKKAANEAYLSAVQEAAKFNFGFNHNSSENFYSSLNKNSFHQESSLEFKDIFFKGIKPIKQKIVENKDGTVIVFKEISYPKSEIYKEKERLEKTIVSKKTVDKKENNNFIGNVTFVSKKSCIIKILGENNFHQFSECSNTTIIPIGKYTIQAQSPGHVDINKDIIVSGQKEQINLSFEKASASLFLKVHPTDSIVTINGIEYSANKQIELESGLFKIKVNHSDYYEEAREIELSNKSSDYLDISLRPKKKNFTIYTEPSGADIYIDGTLLGKSPLVGFETITEHSELTIVKQGFKFYGQIITNQNLQNKLTIKLEQIK